jgi:hypothetical protein
MTNAGAVSMWQCTRRLDRGAALRMLAAGTAWGIAMTAGFAGLALWDCGTVCPDDVALTAATSIAAGILTIGPLAAFGRRPA